MVAMSDHNQLGSPNMIRLVAAAAAIATCSFWAAQKFEPTRLGQRGSPGMDQMSTQGIKHGWEIPELNGPLIGKFIKTNERFPFERYAQNHLEISGCQTNRRFDYQHYQQNTWIEVPHWWTLPAGSAPGSDMGKKTTKRDCNCSCIHAFHGVSWKNSTKSILFGCRITGVRWGSTLWAGPEDDHQVSSMAGQSRAWCNSRLCRCLNLPREKLPCGKFRMAIKTNEHLNPLISY